MADLPRNIREFIVRDLIYIIGGASVITSFLYSFDRLPNQDTPVALYLLGAGFSYVLGSTLQDLFSIVRLVTTANYKKPNKIVKWAYQRFCNEEWKETQTQNLTEDIKSDTSPKRDDLEQAYSERAIAGVILAATMGPCAFISSLIVFVRWLCSCSSSVFDIALSVILLALSSGLILLNWIRIAQLSR